jgi:N-acetylneuraminic acid mutarotase/uncharacterized GH25 family protein
MKAPRIRWFVSAACGLAFLVSTQAAHAHFLWVKTLDLDGRPHAYVLFGETPSDEAYHMPEGLLKTKVYSRTKDNKKRAELTTKSLETEDRVGLVAPLKTDDACVLEATQTYGIYHGTLLTYYAKHVHAESPKELNAAGHSKEHRLDIVPQLDGDKLQVTVTWDGKPLEGSKVSTRVGDEEAVDGKTDKDGRVEVKLEGEGLVSVLANHTDKSATGKHADEEYKGVMHYSSLTFGPPAAAESKEPKAEKAAAAAAPAEPQTALVPLPEPVSSFGAAVADGWLYVYGGHTGDEHEHSSANLSQYFRRIKLEGGTQWEDLAMQMPLQGLALVAHEGKVYRVGGLNARNATKQHDEDLHSTADFAAFDPGTGKWQSLTPLPAPRSSHNAVVIDGKLYVAGGWHLHGQSPGDWQSDALVYDFAKPEAGWQKLPAPPFKRRAISAGHWQGKFVVMGGMDENESISRRVHLFDPQTGSWSEGPRLPGSGMMTFGTAACDLDGQIFVTGLQGVVYRLNEAGSAWEEATRMATGRFFHQLVPTSDGRLLAVGGASREDHLADIEAIGIP